MRGVQNAIRAVLVIAADPTDSEDLFAVGGYRHIAGPYIGDEVEDLSSLTRRHRAVITRGAEHFGKPLLRGSVMLQVE
ncbi:hypothetical protein X739_28750 [Mesorhizobium sp. LNHC220B00]|nr:hypothetical protein X739_28750 [Mesorhizobium sp. LNHC220B00]